jgi:murein L,D-transpeptidase YafK
LRLCAVLGGTLWLGGSVAAMSFLPGCEVRRGAEMPSAALPSADRDAEAPLKADRVLVKKQQRRLYLMRDGQPFRTYRIALGAAPVGHKEQQGDNRTPEGVYRISGRNARSRFTKALHISYPNAADRLSARIRGVDPGGLIMIHGEPRGRGDPELRALLRYEDWTQGCVAVSNLAVDEIWRYVADGTPIEIRP